MPDVNIKGRYRIYTHDGTTPLNFTSYNNSLCSIRRPNPNTFITISTYIPGSLSPFTTFDPGSSYTIVTKSNTADFSMGPYTRADRLPSSVTFKSPHFYHGLDKNSITVALSSYALSVNSPLSTAFTYIPNQDGYFVNSISFNTQRLKEGLPSLLTHLTPNSSYQFINRTPFTFFAPLQSEMGDVWATGYNQTGQLGMGYRYDSYGYTQLYGNWDKVVSSATHAAALSTCGTKKKLFVCGDNSYSQLGLTPLIGYTTQRAVTAIQTVWTEVKNLYYHVWDPTCEGGCYYEDALANETIQDVEVGDYFTLVKTDQYLYGIGNMYALGIAPPGDPSCCPQFEDGYSNTDPVTNYYYNTFLKYFTRFLKRSTSTLFSSITISINDQTLYNEIQSSRLQKFQARGPRWWALYDNKLYACGKIGGTGASLNPSAAPIIPMGLTVNSLSNNTTFREIFALNNPANWNKTYTDFEASRSTVVALSSDNKRWLIGGRRSNTLYMTSLSTMCFYDSQQNSYVPQNDYGLRLFPTLHGAMGIKDGTLYFTPNPVNTNSGGSYIFGLGGNKTISDMPLSSLPKINTALSPNPDEQVGTRSLVPVRYINPNSPNVSWKSLFVGFSYSCAIDGNNKFYICGSNSVGQLGLQKFPADESSFVYTLSNVIPDNVYNVNANDNSAVVYKTNRNPAPSFTPIPSPTPTPSVTPMPQPVYNTGEVMYTSHKSGIHQNRSIWFNDIQYSNSIACSTQVAGVYPYKMMALLLRQYTAPPGTQIYNHYSSDMLYMKPQIEPQSFGSRKCFVFAAEPSVGGVFGGYKDLCFHYFSQAYRPDLNTCTPPYNIISKMAPNSGTFGDGTSSRQRIEIKTNVGSHCLVDFYIKPEDNSYHVIFSQKTNPAEVDGQSRTVYPYYTKSTDRGNSWSTPLLLGADYYSPDIHRWYPCNVGGTVPNTCDPAITNKKGNADKPAVLFTEQPGDSNSAYNVVCKYTNNSLFDQTVTLATGSPDSDSSAPAGASRLNFDYQFSHFKILYDNANRLITLWTGTAGPVTPSLDSYNYVGQGRSRIVYRYLSNENTNTWSPLVTACRTFPHSNRNAGGGRFVDCGRYWDACIDDSDNNLCILYTPDPSNSGGYSFSAFVAKVIKINITTGQTIYDETVVDITPLSLGVSYYPKSIGSVNLYYDSQLNKLVAQCFTRNIQGNDGKLYRMQRNSTNNWSEIPVLGASGGLTPSGPSGFAGDYYNWMTVQRNLKT